MRHGKSITSTAHVKHNVNTVSVAHVHGNKLAYEEGFWLKDDRDLGLHISRMRVIVSVYRGPVVSVDNLRNDNTTYAYIQR